MAGYCFRQTCAVLRSLRLRPDRLPQNGLRCDLCRPPRAQVSGVSSSGKVLEVFPQTLKMASNHAMEEGLYALSRSLERRLNSFNFVHCRCSGHQPLGAKLGSNCGAKHSDCAGSAGYLSDWCVPGRGPRSAATRARAERQRPQVGGEALIPIRPLSEVHHEDLIVGIAGADQIQNRLIYLPTLVAHGT